MLLYFMSPYTFMTCTETPFLVMSYTRAFSGPTIAAPGGRNARLANLWRAGRFPWHASSTAATIFCIYIARPASLYCAEHVYIHILYIYIYIYMVKILDVYICIYIYAYLTPYGLYMNCRCYQTTLQ